MRASSRLRSPRASLPACTSGLSRILMLTSTSEVLTPAELSMKSVLSRPPPSAYSTRPRCDSPRLQRGRVEYALGADAAVPQQLDGQAQNRADDLVGGGRGGLQTEQ